MRHTRAEVIKRANAGVQGAWIALWQSSRPRNGRGACPAPRRRIPWTVKDTLAHITYWKAGVTLSARGQRRPAAESKLKITDVNRLIY